MNRKEVDYPMEWSPSRFFNGKAPADPYALILLNQPLNWTAFETVVKSGKQNIMLPLSVGVNGTNIAKHLSRSALMEEQTVSMKRV